MGSKKHLIKTDCRYYKGSTPCLFHKQSGLICESCNHYAPLKGRILIIKLGAAGDVITNDFGKCIPISSNAEKHKWLTGLNDNISRANTKNYMEEIFEICGYKFNKENYVLELDLITVQKIYNMVQGF